MLTADCDVIVIGAGMAGASAAYELAATKRVIVLEREAQPGYHTTGRSAALFTETYGNAVMRALTSASKGFLLQPPAGFSATPLLTPRGTLIVAQASQRPQLESLFDECRARVPSLALWSGERVRMHVPCFREDQVAAGLWEPDAMDIDVHAVHHGYLRGLRARGGTVHCNAEVFALERDSEGRWTAHTRERRVRAARVVNAAGAWADEIGAMAGAMRIGLDPRRRTVVTFDPPAAVDTDAWPAVIDADENWYFKPDAGRILASLADETPSPPCDAQPEELDIALLVDRLTTATTLTIERLRARWAGLRSFVADRTVIAGEDPQRPGFYWLAAQGGYGIQTAPALARAIAALLSDEPWPEELVRAQVKASDIDPARLPPA